MNNKNLKIRMNEEWEVTKMKLQQKFAKITDSDVFLSKSNPDILSRLAKVLGKSKEEIQKIISEI